MRYSGIICFALFAFFTAVPASAQDVAAPVAACIRDNAAKVEAAVPSLTDANNYLVDSICAPEVTAEMARQQMVFLQGLAAKQKKECEDRQAKMPNPSPQACASIGEANPFLALLTNGPLSSLYPPHKLPEAISMAAKLLLDLRLSHLKQAH